MAMEITNSYNSYATLNAAENSTGAARQKENEKAQDAAENTRSESRAEYAAKLAKLVPSVEFKVGSTYGSAPTGQTLTVDPRLLEKMQNDPELEKKMKELIRGVESMTQLAESLNRASGWKTVYRHSYIDENGQYRQIAMTRNEHGYKMSEKLREERRKNAEKLLERQREKVEKKKEELKKKGQEKRTLTKDGRLERAEKLLKEKWETSKDGRISVNDTEFRTFLEIIREDDSGEDKKKERAGVGEHVDLQI